MKHFFYGVNDIFYDKSTRVNTFASKHYISTKSIN